MNTTFQQTPLSHSAVMTWREKLILISPVHLQTSIHPHSTLLDTHLLPSNLFSTPILCRPPTVVVNINALVCSLTSNHASSSSPDNSYLPDLRLPSILATLFFTRSNLVSVYHAIADLLPIMARTPSNQDMSTSDAVDDNLSLIQNHPGRPEVTTTAPVTLDSVDESDDDEVNDIDFDERRYSRPGSYSSYNDSTNSSSTTSSDSVHCFIGSGKRKRQ